MPHAAHVSPLNHARGLRCDLDSQLSAKRKPSLGVLVNNSLLSINFFLRLGPRAGTLDDLGDFRFVLHLLFQPIRLYKNDVAPEKKPS
jgi:hypothetical protein